VPTLIANAFYLPKHLLPLDKESEELPPDVYKVGRRA